MTLSLQLQCSITVRQYHPAFTGLTIVFIFSLMSFNLICCMLSSVTLIVCRYCVWPSGSCTRMPREAFSQLHCSKEPYVNSKPKPKRASKQDGLQENTPSSQSCVVCVNYHSVAYDPHRFTVREYSFDLEEKRHQEMQQLSVHKKEQYVSQFTVEFFGFVCLCSSIL